MQPEEYLTTEELSKRIKFKRGTIRNLMNSGRLILNTHYVKPTSKHTLFIWSAVEEWLYHPKSKKPQKLKRKSRLKNQCLIDI